MLMLEIAPELHMYQHLLNSIYGQSCYFTFKSYLPGLAFGQAKNMYIAKNLLDTYMLIRDFGTDERVKFLSAAVVPFGTVSSSGQ
jgi:hypothetical protein